jgi:hypothetical protein
MTTIMPEGEEIRKAASWISEQRQDDPKKPLTQLIQEACLKFDLSPMEAEFLSRFVQEAR